MKTLFLSVLLIHFDLSDSFVFKRRRRAPQPVPKDCVLSEWRTVDACSATCGPSGVETQRRQIIVDGRNGGKPCSDYEVERIVACNRVCYNEGELNTAARRCDCPAGYTGECCDQDVDECKGVPSPCSQICVNEPGSFSCECEESYTLDTDNVNCVDAKECQRTPPPCAHRCTELDGGYSCYCDQGYELDADQKNCNDINECKTGSICQYKCVNTPGDYECQCQSGYFRNSDNKTCTDLDECALNNGGCKQSCENLVGSFRCKCGQGYVLANDNISCNDLDECVTHGTTLCEQLCINIPGSYECECIRPYTLNTDLRTCSSPENDSESDLSENESESDLSENESESDLSEPQFNEPCLGDQAACDAARQQAEEQRTSGSDKDSVYNWIIGVLIIVCLVLLMALALLCYRKGYYKMFAPKPPPISTIPRRHNNVVFSPDIDDDNASGVYEDPDDMHYEVIPEGPAYMQMTEPNCKQSVENNQTAEENHYVENDYCDPRPDSPPSPGHHRTHLRRLSSTYVPITCSTSSPSASHEGPVYVEGDSSARADTPDEGGYSSRIEAGASGGFDHEEDDYQNNPPFYDNI